MFVTGVKDGITNAMPELKNISRAAGKEAAESMSKGFTKEETKNKTISYGIVKSFSNTLPEAAPGLTENFSELFSTMFSNIIELQIVPFTENFYDIMIKKEDALTSAMIERAKSAVEKIIAYLDTIPRQITTTYTISYATDVDSLNEAMSFATDSINAAIAKTGIEVSKIDSGRISGSMLHTTDPIAARSSLGTTINYTQNISSPKALSSVEIYRNTQSSLRQIDQRISR